ncbi:MAG: methyl-accepting chemotaxis protein [Desulfovibrio sp.]|uniref:methyl-accepting chemotaxis protein n=1 Tax=Desulfovibrio sp. TaxID=885 RepID=UPI00135E9A32|nr:methyl-accepting chemotaxis protein [Desulfovibrio sp.]MTJ93511.1 methyl-accepting chemotaxis protein [Desulfovibrio sp.]
MNLLKHTRLQTKLIAGFVLSSLVTLAVGVFAVIELHKVNEADTVLYERATVPMKDLLRLSVGFQRIRVNMQGIVGASTETEVQQRIAQIERLRKDIDESSTAVEKTLISDEAKRIIEEYKVHRAAFRQMTDKVIKLKSSGDSQGAEAFLDGEGQTLANQYQDGINRLVKSKEEQGHILAEKNNNLASFSTKMIFLAIALGFFFSVALGILLTRAVMKQLGEDPGYLAEVAGKIAGGDLNVAFRPQKRQGGVYHVLQNMVATMKDKIAEAEQKSQEAAQQAQQAELATQEAQAAKAQAERARAEGMLQAAHQLEGVVEVVSTVTEQLSALIEQSSRGAEEQSHRVTVTSSAMEEMNATVGEVAENAAKASETSDSARIKAQEGAQMVSNVVNDITAVQRQSIEVKTDMAALGKQADGIGQIMSVISDIADQTNLLALNAAIEAARAGDAGRGFAVVADEVRKLAEKTMSATQEVGGVIRGIQEGTRKSIDGVERSVSIIEGATQRATISGESLAQIVTLVEQASDQVRSIATASEEQSASSEEISRAVEQVATISAETAQAMNRASEAMSEMTRQAQVLRQLIGEMKAG